MDSAKKADEDLRKRWNLAADDPVPVTLEEPKPSQAGLKRAGHVAAVRDKAREVETELPHQGAGYKLYGDPSKHYGREAVITKVRKIADQFAGQSLTPIYVGNIGKKGGGDYPPHKGAGHREGFGVDIRPSNNFGIDEPVRWDSSQYNRTNTMMMIHEIKRQHPDAVILFNDPELIRMGLAKPYKGHDDHMHVDFK